MRRPRSRLLILLAVVLCSACISPAKTAAPSSTALLTSAAAGCSISNLRRVGAEIEVEVKSAQEFPVQNELATLRLGTAESRQSRYLDNGDTHTLIFTFSAADFALISDGATALVYYGEPSDARRFDCGRLDKRILPPS